MMAAMKASRFPHPLVLIFAMVVLAPGADLHPAAGRVQDRTASASKPARPFTEDRRTRRHCANGSLQRASERGLSEQQTSPRCSSSRRSHGDRDWEAGQTRRTARPGGSGTHIEAAVGASCCTSLDRDAAGTPPDQKSHQRRGSRLGQGAGRAIVPGHLHRDRHRRVRPTKAALRGARRVDHASLTSIAEAASPRPRTSSSSSSSSAA